MEVNMKMFRFLLVCVAIFAFSTSAVLAYDYNKDLTNQGPEAHDLAVVLAGNETVTSTYNGYHSGDKVGWFAPPAVTTGGGNTTIHWQGFRDGGDNVIGTGQTIHIGWNTQDHQSNVVDMYWTDENGDRISGSIVYNITAKTVYISPWLTITWENGYGVPAGITIRNVHFAIRTDEIPLEELNTENQELENQMMPLTGVEEFTIVNGETFAVTIPEEVPPGSFFVLRYNVDGPGSDAVALDFIQFPINDDATIEPEPVVINDLIN
jgi:hypothetical protein